MALLESAPPSRPSVAAAARDLSDAEFAELAELLAGVPEPLRPLAVDMADGFLAALAVQPAPLAPAQWLPFVFDEQGHRWGEAEPAAEQRRAGELLQRRLAAIERQLSELGGFDPYLLEAPAEASGAAAIGAVVGPWLAGFFDCLELAPLHDEPGGRAVAGTLARLERYLGEPIADPPGSVDAAVGEVVMAVMALRERAERIRYRVETVRRGSAKVGRNEPCPCGSGVKYKQCHGRPAGP